MSRSEPTMIEVRVAALLAGVLNRASFGNFSEADYRRVAEQQVRAIKDYVVDTDTKIIRERAYQAGYYAGSRRRGSDDAR